uniref:V-SNARE coiled-coil homology domain-containing protein n=1 Tax=Amphiprion percula TaxID=161767 RepID=A0A3P8RZN2_AMPPE
MSASGCLPDGEADGCFRPQVVDTMRVNVDNVLERDQKLSELDDRADALQAGASQFESSAAKLKNNFWTFLVSFHTCVLAVLCKIQPTALAKSSSISPTC